MKFIKFVQQAPLFSGGIVTSILLGALIVGCATSPANTATEQALVTAAAATGTALEVQENPSSRVAFVAAAAVLDSLAAGTNTIAAATIESALDASGETNAVVNIALTSALSLADAYISSSGSSNSISPVVGWIGTGITEGITEQSTAAARRQ